MLGSICAAAHVHAFCDAGTHRLFVNPLAPHIAGEEDLTAPKPRLRLTPARVSHQCSQVKKPNDRVTRVDEQLPMGFGSSHLSSDRPVMRLSRWLDRECKFSAIGLPDPPATVCQGAKGSNSGAGQLIGGHIVTIF